MRGLVLANFKLLKTIPPMTKYISLICLLAFPLEFIDIYFMEKHLSLHSLASIDFSFWQPITCAFLHVSPEHILFNLAYFVLYGFFIENEMSKKWFAFFMLMSIIFSFILVQYTWSVNGYESERPLIGLSGVGYGLSASFLFIRNRNKSLLYLIVQIITFLGIASVFWECRYCLFSNCSSVDISDAAHLGGIIGGTIAAILYYNRFTQKKVANL